MRQLLYRWWRAIPSRIRKPIVLTVGMLFILLSGALGWLPGPGGIPLFLIGIAILSTEYHWAERLKRYILSRLNAFSHMFRHPKLAIVVLGLIVLVITAMVFILI